MTKIQIMDNRDYLALNKQQTDNSKRLSIELKEWHYQCGDGCCDMFGTEIVLNGKKCDNQYAGDDVRTALEFVLTELGFEVDINVS